MGQLFHKSVSKKIFSVYTFGDSVLDCSKYNKYSLDPGKLLLENNDEMFPEFKGKDLKSLLDCEIQLIQAAIDGATSNNLMKQLQRVGKLNEKKDESENENKNVFNCSIISIGGNDCLGGLIHHMDSEMEHFENTLKTFLNALTLRPVFITTIYDPTLGDDSLNFFGGDPTILRKNHNKINDFLRKLGNEYGACVDIHDHFLKNGSFDWFCNVIEPSEIGASEIRRCILEAIEKEIKGTKWMA